MLSQPDTEVGQLPLFPHELQAERVMELPDTPPAIKADKQVSEQLVGLLLLRGGGDEGGGGGGRGEGERGGGGGGGRGTGGGGEGGGGNGGGGGTADKIPHAIFMEELAS